MISTVFRGADYPASDRFDQWCEVNARVQAMRHSTENPQAFEGDIRMVNLGVTQLADFRYTPLVTSREPVHVRQDDQHTLMITIGLRGSSVVEHNRAQVRLSAGDMMVNGGWQPFVASTFASQGRVGHLGLSVPWHAIPFAASRLDQHLWRPLRAEGSGTVLVRFLKDLLTTLEQGAQLRPQEAEHLGNAALALSTAMIARLVDAETSVSAEVRRVELVARIRAFVDRHLGDPDLSPAVLAAAHHISVRQLHRVLQEEGTSAAALVRQQRLTRCCRDLTAGPDPVHKIAARWGFTDAAHFSRVFRTTYGHSPMDYRYRHTRAS